MCAGQARVNAREHKASTRHVSPQRRGAAPSTPARPGRQHRMCMCVSRSFIYWRTGGRGVALGCSMCESEPTLCAVCSFPIQQIWCSRARGRHNIVVGVWMDASADNPHSLGVLHRILARSASSCSQFSSHASLIYNGCSRRRTARHDAIA